MSDHVFPKRSYAHATGELGMATVALLVRKHLSWEFRRTPQEADFGIDGYIDVVSPEGYMTGKSIAVQIKSGASYFEREFDNYWTYRGELKHVNYYMNLSMPVVLLLVDTNVDEAWWQVFDPNNTHGNQNGWSIHVPKANRVGPDARARLLSLVGPGTNYLPFFNEFWLENDKIKTSPVVVFVVDREDVESGTVSPLVALFNRLATSPDLLENVRSKVDFLIHGYNDDDRELFEIPEVRLWLTKVLGAVEGLTYFLRLGSLAQAIVLITQCLGDAVQVGEPQVSGNGLPAVKFFSLRHPGFASDFLRDQFNSLNLFAQKHSIDAVTVDAISKALVDRIMAILRGELP